MCSLIMNVERHMSEVPVIQGDKLIHIVVVELHHHSELIRNLCEVLRQGPFRVSLITRRGIFKKTGLDYSSDEDFLEVFLKNSEETVAEFISRMKPVFTAADILYFNTIRHYWKELSEIPFVAPSMVRIHNAHSDLAPATHFNKPLINFFGIVSHLFRKVMIAGEWRSRKRLFSKIDYFMFPNEAITAYVREHGWVREEKILPPVLPFGFLGEKSEGDAGEQKKETVIAITGKVTNAKKDFRLVYLALEQCLKRLKFPVRLVLLGKAGGRQAREIVNDFRSLESEGFTLEYSKDYVPADTFEEKVESVDFLLAPIQVDTHFRKYHEVYGKSKMSGIENDILLYRKPSLVVSDYRMLGPLGGVVDYFEPTADSLAEMITCWVNERTYEALQSGFDDLESYERQGIAKNFYELCKGISERHEAL